MMGGVAPQAETIVEPRPEPKLMTMLDLAAIVVGFAGVFSLIARTTLYAGGPYVYFYTRLSGAPVWLQFPAQLANIVLPIAAALGPAVLVRSLAYHRMPRSGEWLVLLSSVVMVVLAFPTQDLSYTWLGPRVLALGWAGWRSDQLERLWIGLHVGLLLIALTVFLLLRRRLPNGLKTIGLVLLLAIALWVPLPALREGLVSLATSNYNPPFVADRTYRLREALASALGLLPVGLIFGIPFLATLREGFRGRNWLDWTGLISAWMLLPGCLVIEFSRTYSWREYPQVFLGWIALTLVLDFFAARQLDSRNARLVAPSASNR